MKVLVLFDYPPSPGGLSTQGELLYKGLKELGVEAYPSNFESAMEKEWYYRWFEPDVVVGIGYWGHTPDLVLHPQRYGMTAIPWLVADGYIANYKQTLNNLPLIFVTSNWVKEVYIRDGINPDIIEVLPVGCDVDSFVPLEMDHPKVAAIRESFGLTPEQIMILTVGGDATSKGAQEVIKALSSINVPASKWKYICKVWPQPRTSDVFKEEFHLITSLGLERNIVFRPSKISRNIMPYLMAACDIYAAPSRLEGFGMPHIEAGACEKPVIGIKAMAFLDTLVHGHTAFLSGVSKENRISETILGEESGFEPGHKIVFDPPRIADYRASVDDITIFLEKLINDQDLRKNMGAAGRKRAVENYDYRLVAKKFVEIISSRLGIN